MKPYGERLQRVHGGRVAFRYLDVTDSALSEFPEDVRTMAQDGSRLPLTVVDDCVIFAGAFSPSRIEYELRRQFRNRPAEAGPSQASAGGE